MFTVSFIGNHSLLISELHYFYRYIASSVLFAKKQKARTPRHSSPSSPKIEKQSLTSKPISNDINFFKKRSQKRFFNSQFSPFILFGMLVFLILLVAFITAVTKYNMSKQTSQVHLDKPLATETLNKSFTFPIRDDNGNELTQITYILQNAELRDQIIVKGQKASSVKGRAFLVINLKLTNDSEKPVKLNARDYMRLTVNNSDENLAPDIHNDPVEVQAISTKYTRLGFPINISDKNLELHIGEISGDKQIIPLQLK